MGKNAFLEQLRKAKEAHFRAGLESGRQQIIDMVSLVLCDPEIMGEDIFDATSLLRVVKGIG